MSTCETCGIGPRENGNVCNACAVVEIDKRITEAHARGLREGIEQAAKMLDAKADEMEALGNLTAGMMGRVFREQSEAIRALAAR